ncbi:MAG TPA: DUF1697 domain-containing protein [Candidatus Kryptonia bacterium]
MAVYISLLRGINVGGNKIVPMSDLEGMFGQLGFSDVTTYIQSGNIVFKSGKKSVLELEKKISAAIKTRFGFQVDVLVLSLDDLKKMMEKNPFTDNKLKTGERIYFTIMSDKVKSETVASLNHPKGAGDDFKVIGRVAYLLCRTGYSKTVFNNNYIEKILKVTATTRNLETLSKLVEIGNDLAGKPD